MENEMEPNRPTPRNTGDDLDARAASFRALLAEQPNHPKAADVRAWLDEYEAELRERAASATPADGSGLPPASQGSQGEERGEGDDNEDPAARFLTRWFADCAGTVQLWAIVPDGGRVVTFNVPAPYDWSAAIAWARVKAEAGANVYFCPLPQGPDATGPRNESTAFELPGVFADCDDCEPQGAIEKVEAVMPGCFAAAVATSPVGLQGFAKFRAPIRVTNANREQLKGWVYAFGAAVNDIVHGAVGKVDRHDLASLLRVPGTTNWPNAKKRVKGRTQAPVTLLSLTDATIDLVEIARWRTAHSRSAPGGAGAARNTSPLPFPCDREPGALPAGWATWLSDDAILRARFERTQPGPEQQDTTASGYLMSLCHHLAAYYADRITTAEVLAVGAAFYARAGETKDVRGIARTWEKAQAAHALLHGASAAGGGSRVGSQDAAGAQDGGRVNSDAFRLWLDDEWAAQPLPPALVEGLLECGTFALLVGPPGVAKTFVALELSYRIAGGQPFFGRQAVRGPVVYVLGEGGAAFRKRIRAWRRANPNAPQRIAILPQAANLYAPPPRVGMPSSPPDAVRLIAAIDALATPPALIVLDTLARTSLGAEENSARDMGLVVAQIDRLRTRYGCAVLAIHHEAKLGPGGPRGSGALLGACDACFGMQRRPDGLRLTCLKQKDLPEFDPVPLILRPVPIGDGETSCVVEVGRDDDAPAEAVHPRKAAARTDALIALAAFYAPGAAPSASLSRAAGLSRSTGHYAVHRLLARGVFVADGDVYRLSPDIRARLGRLAAAREGGLVRFNGDGPVVLDVRSDDWTAVASWAA
jgi:hypothetical protein